MKYLILFSTMLFFTLSGFGQSEKQTFESPNMKAIIATHKTIAILPIKVTISYKRLPKGFDADGNRIEELKQGINIQEGMYTYLLRKAKSYTVTCQDVQTTNILLKKAGIFDKLDETLKDSICKILKVDAVIYASYAYEKTASDAGAIAKSLLLHPILPTFRGSSVASSVASGLLIMNINDGTTGELIWRFTKEMNESVISSANAMVEHMMRKVARNFPYVAFALQDK